MQMTFSITYYCRKCKVNKGSKLAPIEISICINGERWLITLPRKANPDDFKKEMRSIKQTPLKTYTSAVSAKIEGLQTRLLMEGRPFTREAVREFIYFGFTDNHYTMGYLFNAFLQSQYKKVEAGISTNKLTFFFIYQSVSSTKRDISQLVQHFMRYTNTLADVAGSD